MIEKEIKSYRPFIYFMLIGYIFFVSFGFIAFLVNYLHYCIILMVVAAISVQSLSMMNNRVQYLRFLVYIKKGDP